MALLADAVVLVTGGASGIGRATALLLAREGARVVVSDVNVPLGEETAALIQSTGGGAVFVRCDVSKAEQVQALIEATRAAYGRLDGAFNNAGIGGVMAPLAEQSEADWDAVINVNLKSVWLCLKYEIPLLLQSGGGAIVNTASVAGLVGFEQASAYAASKHGVIGLTKVGGAGMRDPEYPRECRVSRLHRYVDGARHGAGRPAHAAPGDAQPHAPDWGCPRNRGNGRMVTQPQSVFYHRPGDRH